MKRWKLTIDHSQSSYGLPVLVSPSGEAFGRSDLLTLTQAAEATGRSADYLRVACNRGAIEGARKLGRDWVVPGAWVYEKLGKK